MNINDNKLDELMNKTQELISQKKRLRKLILAGSLSAFSVLIAVLAFKVLIDQRVFPDSVLGQSSPSLAAGENHPTEAQMVTPTPLPDGSPWNPDGGPTAEANLPEGWKDWSETIMVNGIEVTINIDINLMDLYPIGTPFSVFEITPAKFDLTFAEKAVDYFLGDDYYEYALTKADYDLEIQAVRTSYESMVLTDQEKTQIENYLDYLESWKADAPESLEKGKLEFRQKQMEGVAGFEIINIRGVSEDAIPHLYIKNEKGVLGSTLSYIRGNPDRNYIGVSSVYDVGFSEDEADKLHNADMLAHEAIYNFTTDMQLSYVAQGYVYDGSTELDTIENHIDYTTAAKCYIFYFTRNYNGLLADLDLSPLPYAENIAVPAPSYDDIPSRHWNEYIKVIVDDLGIASFQWLNKTETLNVSRENAEVLNYDEAQTIFKDEIFNVDDEFDNVKYGLAAINKAELNISYVGLNMVRLESGYGYKMIPAYTIKGVKKAFNHDGYEIRYGGVSDNKNLLIINALDGTIID